MERETYLADEFAPPQHTREDATIPGWLQKEAGMEEDWEAVEKRKLEISAFARDFKRSFPAEAFAGIYQVDRMSGNKTQIKSTDDVLVEAYKWLDKKTKGEATKAAAILDASGLVDEYRTGIMQLFGNAAEDLFGKEHDKILNDNRKTDGNDNPKQPADALGQSRDSESTAEGVRDTDQARKLDVKKAALERKRVVGEYGIIVNDQESQVWRKGQLLKSIATEDFGGFQIIAEEVTAIQSPTDVEALFGLQPAVKWTKEPEKTPEPIVASVGPGSRVVFHAGSKVLAGRITAVAEDNAAVLLDGQDKVEVEVPIENLKAAKDCCVPHLTAQKKFCADCGEKLQ